MCHVEELNILDRLTFYYDWYVTGRYYFGQVDIFLNYYVTGSHYFGQVDIFYEIEVNGRCVRLPIDFPVYAIEVSANQRNAIREFY